MEGYIFVLNNQLSKTVKISFHFVRDKCFIPFHTFFQYLFRFSIFIYRFMILHTYMITIPILYNNKVYYNMNHIYLLEIGEMKKTETTSYKNVQIIVICTSESLYVCITSSPPKKSLLSSFIILFMCFNFSV